MSGFKDLVLQCFAAVHPCGTFGCRMELIHNQDVVSARGVPQIARSLKTVKITVVLERLGANVSLASHLSWRWCMKTETGLGRTQQQNSAN